MAFTLVQFRIKPDQRKRAGVGTISLVVHLLVVGGAVYATARAGNSETTVKADTALVFLEQPRATSSMPPPELDVPLKGFQTLAVPLVTPASIPPVNLAEHFDPKDYSGMGVEGGRANGAPPASAAYTDAEVEEHPELLAGQSPRPEYPDAMRWAGVQGRVLLQAIVDTLGRVEPNSVRITESPNPGFDQSVRAWALKARFRPARLHGRPVRVVISLPIDFSTGA